MKCILNINNNASVEKYNISNITMTIIVWKTLLILCQAKGIGATIRLAVKSRRYENVHEIICHHQSAHFVVCSTAKILYTIHSFRSLPIHLQTISNIIIQLIITEILDAQRIELLGKQVKCIKGHLLASNQIQKRKA
jgi:hypothetical protein